MSKNDLKALLEEASNISRFLLEEVSKGSNFFILTHFDADGLIAGSILASSLTRLKASFHLRVVKDLNEELIDDVLKTRHDILIFSELGSGYLDIIGKKGPKGKTVVIDHHPPVGDTNEALHHINPNLYGFDGSKELSGAGTAYLVAREMSSKNSDLAALAVIGALGDMQDKNERRKLEGLNTLIVDEAINSGFLSEETDLIFFGRETRPLHKAIASTTSPFLPRLSGREDRCLSLLSSVNIPLKKNGGWRTVSELTSDEKQRLISKIIEHLSTEGQDGKIAKNLIGTVYTLLKEDAGTPLRDAREYAVALNACGRMGRYGLGVSISLGDRKSALAVEEVLKEYRLTLAKCMELVSENQNLIQELSHIIVVRGETEIDENMSGAIASMLSVSHDFNINKALLVVTKTEDNIIKVSARAKDELLINQSIDLGKILGEVSSRYDGLGGGHRVAAGAKIPSEKLDTFLKDVNNEIARHKEK